MKVNGVELELNLLKASIAERYEAAFRTMQEDVENIPKGVTLAESIRQQCTIVKHLVEKLFGEGVYEKIVKDPEDLKEHLDLAKTIVKTAQAQKNYAIKGIAKA